MSEAHTVWHALESRRSAAVARKRASMLLLVCLLCAMAVCEVLFLKFVASPDSVNLMVAAEGVVIPQ
jgi:hypothetical protein